GYGDGGGSELPSFPTRRSSDLRERWCDRSGLRITRREIGSEGLPRVAILEGPKQTVEIEMHQHDRVEHHHVQRHPMTEVKQPVEDRKSTRLNSSHSQISYAVFC